MTKSLTSSCWLITGGCGFIGSSLIATLLRDNPETRIRILDNFSVGTKDDLLEAVSFTNKDSVQKTEGIEFVEGDIREYGTCLQCCDGVDVIVHLAANTGVAPSVENPRYDME
jgi:UDP-glucose 4-epimerase